MSQPLLIGKLTLFGHRLTIKYSNSSYFWHYMGTDKVLLSKGIKILGYTVFVMFLAPTVLWQAFKNQEHPFYIPVLIVGLILAIVAIGLGFYGMKIIMDALFSKKK